MHSSTSVVSNDTMNPLIVLNALYLEFIFANAHILVYAIAINSCR